MFMQQQLHVRIVQTYHAQMNVTCNTGQNSISFTERKHITLDTVHSNDVHQLLRYNMQQYVM